MSKICRTCLRKVNKTFKINQTLSFGDSTAKISFVLRFCIPELYLGLSINPEICYDCKESLKVAYIFKKKCLKTENILGDFLKGIRCTGRSVELRDVLSHLDEQAKAKLDVTKTQDNTVFNAEDIISEWEDPPDGEGSSSDLPILDVRQSAPNPVPNHEKPDDLEFCEESGVFLDKQGNWFDFSGKAVTKNNTLSRILKGIIQNDESLTTLQSQLGLATNNEPNADNLFKITNVFSLSEDPEEKSTLSPTVETNSTDSNVENPIPNKDLGVIGENRDIFEIKDEPLDEMNGDRISFNFTPTDEETLDASETGSYDNMRCDSSLQGIIDSIPDINDGNQYVDVPDFVQINNFGLRELEEFRRQQLKEAQKEPDKTDDSLMNVVDKIQLSPDALKKNHVILETKVLPDALYINGKQMVKCAEGYKYSGETSSVLKGVLSPEINTKEQNTIGVQVEVPSVKRRRRRLKIVPVTDESVKKAKIVQKGDDRDVVVLYTNYTMDGIYINDHDYLVNPYKRNKILIETEDEWLCMCYICHKQHHIYEHVRHMTKHGCLCKMCHMDLGTPYMLNVHVRSHVKPCRECTEGVPYGLIDSHEKTHKDEEIKYEGIKRKHHRRKKMDKDAKSVRFRTACSESQDVTSETLAGNLEVKGEPEIPKEEPCVKEEPVTPVKRGRKTKIKTEGGLPVKTRVLRSKARKSYNETELCRLLTNSGTEDMSSGAGPP